VNDRNMMDTNGLGFILSTMLRFSMVSGITNTCVLLESSSIFLLWKNKREGYSITGSIEQYYEGNHALSISSKGIVSNDDETDYVPQRRLDSRRKYI